ncbi:MAG: fibronectin type III domain-containing protein [Candidatus Hatepunaea meridiana]|nr:fibronectin type III domain-containing protein [Candidatus Hatepunaea meridiana]
MRKLTLLLILTFTIGFTGCGKDDTTPTGPGTQAPAAPENLAATVLSDSQIHLTWTDSSSNESGFYIQKKENDSSDWQTVNTLETDTEEFEDTDLEEGSQYQYRIKAYNEGGESDPSNTVDVTTLAKAPSDLAAGQDSTDYTSINLTWLDESEKETGYLVQKRLESDGTYENIGDLDADATAYVDENLDADQCYYYRVCAMIDSIGSLWSNEDSASINIPIPSPPENLEATAISDSEVLLAWEDENHIKTGFHLERSEGDPENWETIAETDSDVRGFTDTVLNEGTEYQYRVKTLGVEDKESEWSDVVTVLTFAKAPLELVAIMDSTVFTTIMLTWTDNSEKETGYQIRRKSGSNGNYEVMAELDPNIVEYEDADLAADQIYYYQVRAMINTIGSLWSNEANAKTDVLTPAPPYDLNAAVRSPNSILLMWSDNSTDNTGFIIERSLQEDTGFEVVVTLEQEDIQTFLDERLSDETTYYYRIAAYNDYGNSDWSNVGSATTPSGPPITPSNLRVEDMTYQEVNLAWDDNSDDETGFQLNRVDSAGGYTDFPDIAANETVFTDNTVEENTTYFYKIRALENSDFSFWSEPILEVTTPYGPPLAPTITELEVLSETEIRITWSADNINNHEGFYLERQSEHEDDFNQIGDFRQDTYSYRNSGLEPNTIYFYRVFAYNDGGRSPASNVEHAQTEAYSVFYDGFENHQVKEEPGEPWVNTENGGSTTRISDEDPCSGNQCAQFIDTNSEGSSRLSLNTDPVPSGNISCWLKLAGNGHFGIIGGDPNNYITFKTQFNPDNTIYFQNGGNLLSVEGFPTEEWFLLSFIFNCRAQAYSIEINGSPKVQNATLQRPDAEGNSVLIFMTYNNAVIEYADLDNVSIDDSENNGVLMPSSEPISFEAEGIVTINDISSAVGPIR